MKTVLFVVLLFVLFAAAAYYGLPVLIERETGGLRSEVQDLKQRLEKIEAFIKAEEEARKITELKPIADMQTVIRAVNTLSLKLTSLEKSFNKGTSETNEILKRYKATTEEVFKKQAGDIDKLTKDIQSRLHKIMFDTKMASIRGHVAKARADLLSRNIATAKTELEVINEVFETLKNTLSDENRKTIEELQSTLKKARSEIDTDLPATINRVDLLWHEMGKLLRKT